MKQEMIKAIEERIGGVEVTESVVKKNNGIVLHGATIRKADEKIAPTIYFDGVPEDEIVDYVVRAYKAHEQDTPKIDIDKILTKENILANVYPQLIGKEQNEERLIDLVHKPYLNMAIIYRIRVMGGNGSFVIRPCHLDYVGISEDELHESAINNIKGNNTIESMGDLICTMAGIDKDEIPDCFDSLMKIVSNHSKLYGATAILDESILVELHEMYGEDFYILPSSIHEVITFPISMADDVSGLREMVMTVNTTELKQEEVLTDSVYIYHDGKLEVA